MLIRCEMLKKLANAFIEVAKEENLPVNITMGRSYTDSGGSRQVGIILEFDSWNSKIINDKLADTINSFNPHTHAGCDSISNNIL